MKPPRVPKATDPGGFPPGGNQGMLSLNTFGTAARQELNRGCQYWSMVKK